MLLLDRRNPRVHTLTAVLLVFSSACGDAEEGSDTEAASAAGGQTSGMTAQGSSGAQPSAPSDSPAGDPSTGAGSAPENTNTNASPSAADDEATSTSGNESTGAATMPEASDPPPADGEPPPSDDGDPAAEAPPAEDTTAPEQPATDTPPSAAGGEIASEASSGCSGSASPPEGPQTMDVDGMERGYIVHLPEGYDPTTPYPLVFAFHGLGGSAELVSSNRFYFGLEQASGGAPSIFVYPDGLETDNGAGWPNTDGQDVAFFDALLADMQATYCVDSARVFSTGHSYGGMMTHTLGCQRADVLRAIAPVAGAMFARGDCAGPVAALGAHGSNDETVDYESGLSAIERVMEANGCDPDSGTPVEPTEFCTAYECDADYPVVWCVHEQNHDWPDFASETIRTFFASF